MKFNCSNLSNADVKQYNFASSTQSFQDKSSCRKETVEVRTEFSHSDSTNVPVPVRGVVIALCCHHRCKWASFYGQEVLSDLGFTATDFHIISHMTSWAVCGIRPNHKEANVCAKHTLNEPLIHEFSTELLLSQTSAPESPRKGYNDESVLQKLQPPHSPSEDCNEPKMNNLIVSQSHVSRTGYVPHPKEDIGLKCKRLLDFARVRFLRQAGFDAHLIYYTSKEVSLENVLLIARPL